MKVFEYEKKINDVILKAPIESGVQILVYNVIDEMVTNQGLTQIVVDDCQKEDSRFGGLGGVPDLAIVSDDFEFGDMSSGKCYGCVEVKAANESLEERSYQLLGHVMTYTKVLHTNGIVWGYYDFEKSLEVGEGRESRLHRIDHWLKKEVSTRSNRTEHMKVKREIKKLAGLQWEVNLVDGLSAVTGKKVTINPEKFQELMNGLNEIKWQNGLE